MFGDKLIIGKSTRKLDEKGRLFIPTFTNAEDGDEIVIESVKEKDCLKLRLVAYQEYYKLCERFLKLRDNATSLEEYKKYEAEIEKICSFLETRLIVDSQRRLRFPKEVIENTGLQLGQEYECIGQGISLLISKK